MDTREKLIKARLGLLALAEQLQNVRQACKAAGISRSHYYEIKQAYEKYGAEGLAPQARRHSSLAAGVPGTDHNHIEFFFSPWHFCLS